MPAPAKPFYRACPKLRRGSKAERSHWRQLIIAAFIGALCGCSTVDGGDQPDVSKPAEFGTLTTSDGKVHHIHPGEFNFTGAGSYTWPDGRSQEGIFDAGRLQGMGSEVHAGTTYTGQWRNGIRHGHGELVASNGDRYVGDFVEGKREGKGTSSTSAGVYRGTWRANHFEGQGQFNSSDGAVYQGQWQAGQRRGYGRETAPDGSSYEGEWAADLPNGFGKFESANAESFEGSWVSGQRAGYGVATYPDGTRYEGTWQANERHGFGREDRPDKSHFAGEWQHGKRQGKGAEVNADGSAHEGIWLLDRIGGEGTRINTAGIRISGIWDGNHIETGHLALPSGAHYQGPLFVSKGRGLAPSLMNWLDATARTPDAHAQYFLGNAYLDFEQPPPDLQTAKIWLERAAGLGQQDAQFRLSQLLVDEDASRAVTLLQQAAAQNHALALATLGEYYHAGRFLPRNFSSAIKHYEAAAERGIVSATNNLAWLLATTDNEHIANPERAVTLIQPLVLYFGNWQHLDTLAAAHARLGQTELAARLQEEALRIAERYSSQADLERIDLAQMRARRDLYRAALPYIETAPILSQ